MWPLRTSRFPIRKDLCSRRPVGGVGIGGGSYLTPKSQRSGAPLALRTAKRLPRLPGRLQLRLVIRHQPESPLNQHGVVLIERLPPIQKRHRLLLERVLLAGLIEDLENFHREKPIVAVLFLLGLPDFAQPFVADLALANVAHLRVKIL